MKKIENVPPLYALVEEINDARNDYVDSYFSQYIAEKKDLIIQSLDRELENAEKENFSGDFEELKVIQAGYNSTFRELEEYVTDIDSSIVSHIDNTRDLITDHIFKNL